MIDELTRALGERIIILQEVARLPKDPIIDGWMVLHEESSASAIAILT